MKHIPDLVTIGSNAQQSPPTTKTTTTTAFTTVTMNYFDNEDTFLPSPSNWLRSLEMLELEEEKEDDCVWSIQSIRSLTIRGRNESDSDSDDSDSDSDDDDDGRWPSSVGSFQSVTLSDKKDNTNSLHHLHGDQARGEARVRSKVVRFAETLVTSVRERPRTTPDEWSSLYYTCHELQKMCESYAEEKKRAEQGTQPVCEDEDSDSAPGQKTSVVSV